MHRIHQQKCDLITVQLLEVLFCKSRLHVFSLLEPGSSNDAHEAGQGLLVTGRASLPVMWKILVAYYISNNRGG